MEKPNLFEIATSELSQDGFITWLLQWADDKFLNVDRDLNNIGKDFINFLFSKTTNNPISVKAVSAQRQWNKIDIFVEVNNLYIIAIEDKTYTGEHDEQLDTYKEIVEKEFNNKTKLYIYLKTGLDSIENKLKIENKGWKYIDSNEYYKFLSKNIVDNDIYKDYVDNLKKLFDESRRYNLFEKLKSNEATKGLYLFIQEYIKKKYNEYCDWDYVSNKNGGFYGLWLHFTSCKSNIEQELYLQIENNCEQDPKLCIRIKNAIVDLKSISVKIINEAENFKLKATKPKRLRRGETSAIALIECAFIEKTNHELDINNLIEKIESSRKLIDKIAQII